MASISFGHQLLLFAFYLMYSTVICQEIGCLLDKPLGMIDGTIRDWQITTSSSYPQSWDKHCHAGYARPYTTDKRGWCAKYKSSSEWLQIDLGVAAKITGVLLQGRADGMEWVTAFMLSHSVDSDRYPYATDLYGNQKIFEGNSDSYLVKHVYLDQPILARYVRVHTIHWHKHPSLRIELLGCQVCREPLGLPPYGKLSVSSASRSKRGSSCQAQDGHILSSKAWCAKKQRDDEWIQLDVGPPTLVTALVTRGRGDSRKEQWVSRYRVSYSNDSRIWHYYKDQRYLQSQWSEIPTNLTLEPDSNSDFLTSLVDPVAKTFSANSDKNSQHIHYLSSPFRARFVRFHPVVWSGRIAMRVGLLGCPHSGDCGPGFLRVMPDTQCVENLAFGKDSFIKKARQHKKRNTDRGKDRQWERGYASRAVDGDLSQDIHKCVILDNRETETPVWMVDLGTKTEVAGVVLNTWKKDKPPASNADAMAANTLEHYTMNLDKITVFVGEKNHRNFDTGGATGVHECGFVTKLNGALSKPSIHVQCSERIRGRYVYLKAWGTESRWSPIFSAVLCEVQVYS